MSFDKKSRNFIKEMFTSVGKTYIDFYKNKLIPGFVTFIVAMILVITSIVVAVIANSQIVSLIAGIIIIVTMIVVAVLSVVTRMLLYSNQTEDIQKKLGASPQKIKRVKMVVVTISFAFFLLIILSLIIMKYIIK